MTAYAMLLAAFAGTNLGEDLSSVLIRWAHITAGILWIGHLYFFNFVNAELAKTYDADSKKKVVPELMPRALYWFRWGAAWTWITGVLLLAILYWHQPYFSRTGESQTGPALAAFAILAILFVVYDRIATGLQKQPLLALWLWYALVFLFVLLLTQVSFFGASNRAAFIHAGGMLGTAMAANVWMRIWPCQRRIITAIKAGQAPDPNDAALAGMRSKHNTFMSVPLLMLMLSVHGDLIGMTAGEPWQWLIGLFVLGFLATQLLYTTSTKVKGF
jgi:uncharacterized membrane protein